MENSNNDFKLTVGRLLEFIEKHEISRSALIKFERVEDFYFNVGGWKSDSKLGGKCEYIDATACVKFANDPDLYIDAHH